MKTIRHFILVGIVAIVAVAVSRQFVALGGPRAPREMLATMSGLPLPWFLTDAQGEVQCSGLSCMDYTMHATSTLSPSACERAMAAAPAAGYQPVQSIDSATRRSGHAARLPTAGLYRYQRLGADAEVVVWLDAAKCVLTARYSDS